MKFVCVSDFHTQYEKLTLPKIADVLIIAGDIGIDSSVYAVRFTNWLDKQPFTYKIVIGGNHDGGLLDDSTINHVIDKNCIYLLDDYIEIEGIKIWGSPYTPTFNNWYFMADRGEEIRKHWNLIPEDVDIIVTHGPPYGILDTVEERKDNIHLGCDELVKAINRIKPVYHIFGHIHSSGGKIIKKERTTFINCSVCDEAYDVVNKPVEFEYIKQ